jgi:hypothetical protein
MGGSATVRGNKARIGKLMAGYWPQAIALVLAFLVWAPRLSGPIDLRWDAGVYYVLGTSLATGHGYRILSEPGLPQALQYPPLLPAVVAAYELALGSTKPDVVAPSLRKLYFVIFVGYAMAVVALARRHLRPWLAVVASALCLLQIRTILLSDLLFAELPFALISVVFVLVVTDSWFASRPLLRETVSFVLAAAGFLLRTAGIALLAAWVVEALVRRRWRLALSRSLLALLPVIAWETHVARVHGSYDYRHPAYAYQRAPYQNYNVTYAENVSLRDPFRPERGSANRGALAMRLLTNLVNMPAGLGEAVSTSANYWRNFLSDAQAYLHRIVVIPRFVIWLPIFTLAALIMGGFVVFILHHDWVLASIPLFSVALICLTPWPEEFRRYLMPMAPFLTIAVVLASERLDAVGRARGWRRTSVFGRVALVGLFLLTFAVQTYAAVTIFRSRGVSPFFNHYRWWDAWEEAAAWVGARALPSDVVATIAPHQFYLRTGLHAVYPPMDANPVRARRLLAAVPVSYVIVDEFPYRDFSRRYALPSVEGDPAAWHLVHSVDGTQIYERAIAGK